MITEREKMKEKAKQLLEELPNIKPADLPNWNIKAQTLLVFETMRQHCEGNIIFKNSVNSVAQGD